MEPRNPDSPKPPPLPGAQSEKSEPLDETKPDLAALLVRIRARLHQFDPISLLRVLMHNGVSRRNIEFRSHHSKASQGRLMQDIELVRDGVIIWFNLGLLSAQSPLPSYFFKEMDNGFVDPAVFEGFIGYFDHALIELYLHSIYPELNTYLFPDWSLSLRRRLCLQNLRSMAGLHWLFGLVFPEFGVEVHKVPMNRRVKTEELRLGEVTLGGDAVFGQSSSVPILGLQTTLVNQTQGTDRGRPWFEVIDERMKDVVAPILEEVGVQLELVLLIEDMESVATLAAGSYVGYDRVQAGGSNSRRLVLFKGHF